MFVAITCPTCRHRGYISKDMLPRWLSCSHCRSRARFDRGSPLSNEEVIAKASYAARQSPDHLLDALWRDGARPAIGGQAAHQRWGAADCREYDSINRCERFAALNAPSDCDKPSPRGGFHWQNVKIVNRQRPAKVLTCLPANWGVRRKLFLNAMILFYCSERPLNGKAIKARLRSDMASTAPTSITFWEGNDAWRTPMQKLSGSAGCMSPSNRTHPLPEWQNAMSQRRFPPPWSVEELDACFVVKDGARQKVAQDNTRAGSDVHFWG